MRLGFVLGLLLGFVAVYLLTVPTQGAGYTVNLNTTSGITEAQVRSWLDQAGYEPLTLLVRVDVVDSGLNAASIGCDNGTQPASSAIQFTSSALLSHPLLTASHEYGHVWSQYHRCLNWQDSFDSYLQARGIFGVSWIDYTTAGCRNPEELMAHDYEQLFGKIEGMDEGIVYISCAQQEWQVGLKEPWDVPGFRDWYGLTFTQGHPPPGYGGAPSTPTPTVPVPTFTSTPSPIPSTATSSPSVPTSTATSAVPTSTRTPKPVGTCYPPKAKRCR